MDQFFKDENGKVYFLSEQDQQTQAGKITLAENTDWIPITPDQAQAITSPGPTPAQLLLSYQQSALLELGKSDITQLRIIDAIAKGANSWANPDVVAWVTYREQLRTAAKSLTIGTLPTKPDYPSGT